MSRLYSATAVTLTIAGGERDLAVRGLVDLEPSRSRGMEATLDGEPECFLDGAWVSFGDVEELDAGDRARAEEILCDLALEDDRDACVDHDREEF